VKTDSPQRSPTHREVQHALRALGNPAKAQFLKGFFKTGPGQYAEGDQFLGVTVPQQRKIAKEFTLLPFPELERLLASSIHEDRLVALIILVQQFQEALPRRQGEIYRFYLARAHRVNNWDLVDLSAPKIVGAWMLKRSRRPLHRLVTSPNLWKRRIAIVATHAFIRLGDFQETLLLAQKLLQDREDLMHKATGWMLREVGKHDPGTLREFLDHHAAVMPRTMLRYAIERFPQPVRQRYLRQGRKPRTTIHPKSPR